MELQKVLTAFHSFQRLLYQSHIKLQDSVRPKVYEMQQFLIYSRCTALVASSMTVCSCRRRISSVRLSCSCRIPSNQLTSAAFRSCCAVLYGCSRCSIAEECCCSCSVSYSVSHLQEYAPLYFPASNILRTVLSCQIEL